MKEEELSLRITLLAPPPDVAFCLQRGRSELVSVTFSTGESIHFDFTVRARKTSDSQGWNFLGPFTQGTPATRFVYINAGTFAGQEGSCWSRRAKAPLTSLAPELVETALTTPGARLAAEIWGRAGDGGPACASVPLLGGGWSLEILNE